MSSPNRNRPTNRGMSMVGATRTGARRRIAWITAVAAMLVVTGGWGGGQPAATPSAPAETSQAAEESGEETAEPTSEGTLAPPERATNAFTYNPALAPEGATLTASIETAASATSVTLDVGGLLP